MLSIDRTVSARVDAPPARCISVLADISGYPAWSSLIESAEVVGERVRMRASVLGVGFEMDCVLSVADGEAALRRLPNDPEDEERFEASWTVAAAGEGGSDVMLHVAATLDAPGPARLLRGRVERRLADDLLADFTRAVEPPP